MINPNTLTEQLLFTTVRIESENRVGTGFIFSFNTKDNKVVPFIFTNKHVINGSTKVKFTLHIKKDSLPTDENITLNYNAEWLSPSDDKLDLCCTPFAPIVNQIKETYSKEIFYYHISHELIWNDEKLDDLTAVEDIFMIGYPIGLTDLKNNLPLVRKGITASHPATNFNGENIGVVDIACFPGSSGSPIFIINNGSYIDKKTNSFNLGSNRIIFLGILFGGPYYNNKGQIEIKSVPTSTLSITEIKTMIHLGYYMKARELLTFPNSVFLMD